MTFFLQLCESELSPKYMDKVDPFQTAISGCFTYVYTNLMSNDIFINVFL